MNSKIGLSKVAAAALLCGVVLAGCNAVEDVRSEPATNPPPQAVVLEGKVFGLGIRRSIGLQNGSASKLVQGFLGEASGARGRESRFTFGALQDGSAYNITVTPGLVPYGKLCTVNNGSGTLRYNEADTFKGAPQNIEVVCVDNPAVARYDIRVATPAAFRDAAGARVSLMTEEGVYEQDPKDLADGDLEYVWFRKALITVPLAGVLPFQNIIKAYTTTGSTASLKLVNRCAVANHTFPSPAGTGADVTNVAVGNCTFTAGGTDVASGGAVKYSRPIGVTTDPAMGAGGVTLELRYPDGRPVQATGGGPAQVNITSFNSNFTFPTRVTSGAECPAIRQGETPIPCEIRGFYEVVVTAHPAGQRCLAATTTVGQLGPLIAGNPTVGVTNSFNATINWAGAANLFLLDESVATGVFPFSPGDFTGLRVYCRNIPTDPARRLQGVFQLTNQTVFNGIGTSRTIAALTPWSPAYAARRVYSDMLALFDDGTFIFSAHTAGDAVNTTGVSNHAEQGFYDYAPNTVADGGLTNRIPGNKLRFTIHIDGSTGATTNELAAGLSSAEGPSYVNPVTTLTTNCTLQTVPATANANTPRHWVMADVVLGTGSPRTLSGTFGIDTTPTRCQATNVTTAPSRLMEFVEPRSTNGQMDGTWISQDRLRVWSFNSDTTVGYHAGTNGFPNLQDTCFKMDDYTQPSGQYVPSTGGATAACAPVGNLFNSGQSSLGHSPSPANQTRLPGWQGWMPGSELTGGRSPSPVYFVVAPVANFAATATTAVFPASTIGNLASWCSTEVLGVRGTQNGELVSTRQPLYFCRYRAN
jgi:hypothetical protein